MANFETTENTNINKKPLSRREFMTLLGGAGAGTALVAIGLKSKERECQKIENPLLREVYLFLRGVREIYVSHPFPHLEEYLLEHGSTNKWGEERENIEGLAKTAISNTQFIGFVDLKKPEAAINSIREFYPGLVAILPQVVERSSEKIRNISAQKNKVVLPEEGISTVEETIVTPEKATEIYMHELSHYFSGDLLPHSIDTIRRTTLPRHFRNYVVQTTSLAIERMRYYIVTEGPQDYQLVQRFFNGERDAEIDQFILPTMEDRHVSTMGKDFFLDLSPSIDPLGQEFRINYRNQKAFLIANYLVPLMTANVNLIGKDPVEIVKGSLQN